MKFSDAQQKEVIEANSGQLLGFIVDAEIDKETGFITSFIVETNGAYPTFFNKKRETKKIDIQNIAIIGKDVIIVSKNRE
ncbi:MULTISPECIES: YlmC/YmxH family sporulation protein [unclassified Psychrobacillus]|jgi:YlmC/YmxH family sporulation protein|uniref:YlmC/YmxH family sporulation protein n=1 Tax=unclassified Psychrobacillus TaxID=2636677 RepID=UPI0011A13CA4|nr:YlmC/YmxH family sporulation protein [Psychrobacillus sp. AK 1817]QEY20261.1 YlmC/YmxH family sporulation protein [Psychrobacillus sp. AK 1817]QGM30796.1 YlmC/YmxH family sporulation protein [Bacillus sp. N3536]